MAWIVFLVVALPLLLFLAWLLLGTTYVRIPPGKIGLLLVRGKATDTALLPGPHFVGAFRRRIVLEYPSNELSYRAGDTDSGGAAESTLEHTGPPLHAMLGDRAKLELGYTVRFRLRAEELRSIHERFSADGIWAAVRDESGRTIRARLSEPRFGVDDLFGAARPALEGELATAVRGALSADGFEVTMFSLGDIDLGRTGEVIQSTVRARHELEREEAEAATRRAQVRLDAELQPYLAAGSGEGALRYREVDVWRELATSGPFTSGVAIPVPTRTTTGSGASSATEPEAAADSAEP